MLTASTSRYFILFLPFLVASNLYLGSWPRNHLVQLCLVFQETAQLTSEVAVPFHMPTIRSKPGDTSAQEFRDSGVGYSRMLLFSLINASWQWGQNLFPLNDVFRNIKCICQSVFLATVEKVNHFNATIIHSGPTNKQCSLSSIRITIHEGQKQVHAQKLAGWSMQM